MGNCWCSMMTPLPAHSLQAPASTLHPRRLCLLRAWTQEERPCQPLQRRRCCPSTWGAGWAATCPPWSSISGCAWRLDCDTPSRWRSRGCGRMLAARSCWSCCSGISSRARVQGVAGERASSMHTSALLQSSLSRGHGLLRWENSGPVRTGTGHVLLQQPASLSRAVCCTVFHSRTASDGSSGEGNRTNLRLACMTYSERVRSCHGLR
mmetsp:Transcript_15152/g.45692  ORF Transcript_15152/g.45692 Transcript_15152/m.45692 type:complete len:208 (+) Transcript_15152:678-1301(+)